MICKTYGSEDWDAEVTASQAHMVSKTTSLTRYDLGDTRFVARELPSFCKCSNGEASCQLHHARAGDPRFCCPGGKLQCQALSVATLSKLHGKGDHNAEEALFCTELLVAGLPCHQRQLRWLQLLTSFWCWQILAKRFVGCTQSQLQCAGQQRRL